MGGTAASRDIGGRAARVCMAWSTNHPNRANMRSKMRINAGRTAFVFSGVGAVAAVATALDTVSAFPHFRQNWESSEDSNPHLGQNIVGAASLGSPEKFTTHRPSKSHHGDFFPLRRFSVRERTRKLSAVLLPPLAKAISWSNSSVLRLYLRPFFRSYAAIAFRFSDAGMCRLLGATSNCSTASPASTLIPMAGIGCTPPLISKKTKNRETPFPMIVRRKKNLIPLHMR